jgi:hypothetical protein
MYWWMLQRYEYVPALEGATKCAEEPAATSIVLNTPESDVRVWVTESLLSTVTVAPGCTVSVFGLNAKFWMSMVLPVPPPVAEDVDDDELLAAPDEHDARPSINPAANTTLTQRDVAPRSWIRSVV